MDFFLKDLFYFFKVKQSIRQVRLVFLCGKQILSFKTIRTFVCNTFVDTKRNSHKRLPKWVLLLAGIAMLHHWNSRFDEKEKRFNDQALSFIELNTQLFILPVMSLKKSSSVPYQYAWFFCYYLLLHSHTNAGISLAFGILFWAIQITLVYIVF